MPEAPKILYVDLELGSQERIEKVGAVLGSRELHERNTDRLVRWVQEADYICGHNVVAHDLPLLRKHLGTDPFAGKEVIDTLLWSPLLFPDSPYHKLVKGYQLVNADTPNDPLADSKLCKEFLHDEVIAFEALDGRLKAIYHGLLGDRPGYQGLFQLTGTSVQEDPSLDMRIKACFQGRLCATADLAPLIQAHPMELAYALALIDTTSSVSILPEYVVAQFPLTRGILEQLRFTACDGPACSYCANNLDPKRALGERFGHADFRLFRGEAAPGVQERAVHSAVMGESLLAVFPTGGGKSITFQLPALMRGELTRDLTVVISPLVSLMKDQVDVLKGRHGVVNAAYISGLLSPLERDEALEQVRSGAVHLLYLSPESLRSPTIFRLLCGRNIARFVIDEAHCFSSWGQDFRVDYLYIADFIKTLQQEKGMQGPLPVSCFTATAKPQVVEDIRSYFKERLGLELQLFVTRAPRENLSYEVVAVEDPDQKPAKLVEILKENEAPAIVYVSRTKRVRELVEHLGKSGFRATGFHGQMERDEKQRNQKAFMNDEVDVMVATSAFGMGVDKEDVKTIIHFNISDSLESYIQEAGRAGRRSDIEAKCFVLYHENDLANHFRMHQSAKLNLKQIDQVWRAIKNLTKVRSSINRSALEIAKAAGWDVEMKDLENKLKTAVAALEDRGYLARKLNYTAVKATSILVRNVNEAVKRINASGQLSESQKLDCVRMVQRIVKDKDRTGETRIDYLADALGMHVGKAQETIERLREVGILADGKDLTAVVDRSPRSKRAAHIRARDVMAVEKALLGLFTEEPVRISLKELNQRLLDKGTKGTSTEIIHSLLLFWELRRLVTKKRVKRQEEVYAIRFKKPPLEVLEQMEMRHALAAESLGYLGSLADAAQATPQGMPVTFSLLELKKQVELNMLGAPQDLKDIEHALLFLNQLKAIQLQGGFMVYFQRLHIERKELDNRIQYKQADYEKLLRFYTNKVEQIHIVGEYARKRIASYTEALAFVDDYFKLGYEVFVRKYFPNRRTEIKRTMTESRFRELFGKLSLAQRDVVDDKSPHILVSAGPGSGKTKVLVHKIASLLLMEDIKPEQFLMLTFSKSAALEFRSRVHKLVPEYRGLLKIFTFHGFCFDLLGEVGDLERSEQVIAKAIAVLAAKDNDDQLSTVLNKSVLVLDEFQDVTNEEWRLIQALAERIPNLRIVAVGDDDQNIYEWRGASQAHWQAFIRRFAPKEHALLTNYRSAPNIVAFNNHIVEGITQRSKKKEQAIEAS
ncbi:MAG: RecQ family ATP-dependent DNA helicase, partial [Flavobacteriales bacterium]|nr:RecQ family ATP-dependent DNA helicase [Flavobacteriales bacterium]